MIHIFDGATGTMLQAAGLKAGECPELVNLERPEMMKKIHEAYVAAGSTILETNTFGGCALKLEHYGLAGKARDINIAAVRIAKEAAAGRAEVAGSMGPTGRFITPLGDLDFEEAYQTYAEQAAALEEGGADYILIETSIDIQETRAALLAAKEATRLPVICQLSYSEDGRTVTGTDPETAAVTLDALGADIIGVNCSLGPEQLLPIVKLLAQNTDKPISVQPNAGLPQFVNGKTVFPMGPEDFARWVPDRRRGDLSGRLLRHHAGTYTSHRRRGRSMPRSQADSAFSSAPPHQPQPDGSHRSAAASRSHRRAHQPDRA